MNEEVTPRKKAIRKAMMARRRALEVSWIQAASKTIAAGVAALPAYRQASTVCLFASMADEVQLDALHQDCLRAGRRVLLPAFRADAGCYAFKAWTPGTALISGHRGIREPGTPEWALPGADACILVPGMAFDPAGGRIGFGCGYYDRLLERLHVNRQATAVGVCFDFQVLETVPQAAHDVSMDMLVSETRTVDCRLTV